MAKPLGPKSLLIRQAIKEAVRQLGADQVRRIVALFE